MTSPLNPFNMPAGASLNPGSYSPASLTYSFTTSVSDNCWDSDLTDFEEAILLPFVSKDLEELRALLCKYSTSPYAGNKAARAILQMAHETELSNIIEEYAPITDAIINSNLCNRNRYLDIDKSLRTKNYLYASVMDTLALHGVMPLPYKNLFLRHLNSDYPKYRIAAVSAVICYAVKMRDIDSTL